MHVNDADDDDDDNNGNDDKDDTSTADVDVTAPGARVVRWLVGWLVLELAPLSLCVRNVS